MEHKVQSTTDLVILRGKSAARTAIAFAFRILGSLGRERGRDGYDSEGTYADLIWFGLVWLIVFARMCCDSTAYCSPFLTMLWVRHGRLDGKQQAKKPARMM
jgi:hypothetical protein